MTSRFSFAAAISVVIANMVGTGVFTSLGFQLLSIQSGFVLIMLWVVGGVAALCGALSYAELGAALPRSGGEYNFLSRIYHPLIGFMGGWVSASIGFTAPVALAAMTFSAYATSAYGAELPQWIRPTLAILLIVVLTVIHAGCRQASGGMQLGFTILKVLVILGFCGFALALGQQPQQISFLPQGGDLNLMASGAFAVSLIYVSYAYTGWNAATYLSGEINNPQRQLPIILVLGTLVVMLLYVLLNAVFLSVAPMGEMRGVVEIGYVAAQSAFGTRAAGITGLVLALLLISTVSAMTIAGPRVLQVVGEDFTALRVLAKKNEDGIPFVAIVFQSTLAIIFILTSTFESILVFSGFTLALNSFAAVLGLFVLRWRQPDLARPFRVSVYPLPPLIYLGITGWTLIFVLIQKPVEAFMGLGVIGAGGLIYLISRKASVKKQ